MRLYSMSLRLTLWLFFSLISLAPLASAQPIFTVNSASDTDDGVCNPSHCSLREAIVSANAELGSGPQIHFAIPGDGVHSIAPTAQLPTLTHSSVIVDGWTQPGASCASWPPALRIELDGTNAGMSNGLVIAAPNAEVRGLVINRFAEAGVRIENSGSGVFVECNFIGTDPTGTLALANGLGVEVVTTNYATVGNRNNTRLGNLISGNTGVGVHVDTESGGIQVRGNSIGTDVTGLAALGNLQGVLLEHKNSVGTSDPAFANLISGNIESGIVIRGAAASESGVYGNDIGLDALGLPTLGNGGAGISIEQGASKCQIGFDLGLDNRIADNGGGGVVVSGSNSIENLISYNSMEGNAGPGINLLGAPFDDPNDAGDPDEGPNRLQNTPVLLSAERPIDQPSELHVVYAVDTDPLNAHYPLVIEFFRADADGTEGAVYLGSDWYDEDDHAAEPDGSKAVVIVPPAGAVRRRQKIGATARDYTTQQYGGTAGNTSEFSAPATVPEPDRALAVLGALATLAVLVGRRSTRPLHD
jgi:CSLREA domain-containing protein